MNNIAFENEADKRSLSPPPYEEGNYWSCTWYVDPTGSVEPRGYPNPPPQTEGPGPDNRPPPYSTYLYPPYLEDPSQWPTAVTAMQPMSMPTTPAKVHSYLGYSIATMIFCCLPLGIAALIFSLRTMEERTNQLQALKSSRKALILNHMALASGGLLFSLITILLLVFVYA